MPAAATSPLPYYYVYYYSLLLLLLIIIIIHPFNGLFSRTT